MNYFYLLNNVILNTNIKREDKIYTFCKAYGIAGSCQ